MKLVSIFFVLAGIILAFVESNAALPAQEHQDDGDQSVDDLLQSLEFAGPVARPAVAVLRSKRNARICRWMQGKIGYACDGPVERALWRGYWGFQGVSSCADLCRSQGSSSGSCVQGARDRSTWCPSGQSCRCY